MPKHPEPTDRAEVTKLANAVDEALAAAMPTRYDNPDLPSHKDGPQIGGTPPVAQPDSRIAPQWAVGVAVASIGVGAGVTGLGCAAWLVLKGMSLVIHSLESVTLLGVLAVATPFAGFAMAATAVGGLISKAKKATPTEIHQTYTGPVYQDQRNVHTSTRGVWAKTTNQQ